MTDLIGLPLAAPPKHPPITELVSEYLEWAEHSKGLRPLTLRMYRFTLAHWSKQMADTNLADVTPEDVEAFSRRPVRGGTAPAAATSRRELVTVKKFMDWCASRKRIACYGHLTAVAPKTKSGVPKPIPDELWRELWESEDLFPDDRLWLGLGYFCGLRRYEMVTIRPSEVDPDRRVMQFERKGGFLKSLDYLSMAASVADKLPWVAHGWEEWMDLLEFTATQRATDVRLSVYATADDPFLDGNRLSKRLGRTVLPRCGMKGDAFTLHQLRHSCATNLFRAGWQAEVVQKAMSHSSFDITAGYMDVAGYMRADLTERGVL